MTAPRPNLQAILELDRTAPIDTVPTYMGAHAIPPKYKGDTAGYTRFLCEEALPITKQWWLDHANGKPLPFVDVFCEAGVFEIAETREILSWPKRSVFRSSCMPTNLRIWAAPAWQPNLELSQRITW